jgi:hypothetical protein
VSPGDEESTPGTPDAGQWETVAGAGWHPDPFDLADERWWDGSRWTTHVREAPLEESDALKWGGDEEAGEPAGGQPPGWYPWRGEVARGWDGEEWGPARRPFIDRLGRPSERWARTRARLGYAGVLALVLLGVILLLRSGGDSSSTGYEARIGRLCTRTFAMERSEIMKEGTAAVAGRRSHPQAVFVGELLRSLARENAAFDSRLQAIAPPAPLRGAQQRYLKIEHQDSAIYALVIPRVEGQGGLPALTTVTGLLSKNAEKLQRLLIRLGGRACSISPLGLE